MTTEANEKPTRSHHVPKHAPRRIDGIIILGFAAGALIAIGITVASLLGDDERRPDGTRPEPARRASACSALEEAARHFARGSHQQYRQAILDAALAAEKALETSGQVFGGPEKAALRLRSLQQQESENLAQRLLDSVLGECAALNQFPTTGTSVRNWSWPLPEREIAPRQP